MWEGSELGTLSRINTNPAVRRSRTHERAILVAAGSMQAMRWLPVAVSLLFFGAVQRAAPQQVTSPGSYDHAVMNVFVGADARVHILLRGGREFVAPQEAAPDSASGAQEGAEQLAVARDGRTVGWLADFPGCCQSYPIPRSLVIYRAGQIVQRMHSDLGPPIWKWQFRRGSKQVAYYVEYAHGGRGVGCELRDVKTGRLLAKWQRESGKPLPGWAEVFRVSAMN